MGGLDIDRGGERGAEVPPSPRLRRGKRQAASGSQRSSRELTRIFPGFLHWRDSRTEVRMNQARDFLAFF